MVELIMGGIIAVLAILLIVVVALQSNNDSKMSGTITGSAETFFGQSKTDTRDRRLSRWTVILSIAFALAVIVMYIL